MEGKEKDPIIISYNDEEEMLSIKKKGKSLFYGNYTDFSREPKELAKLFRRMGLEVELDSKLPSIG